MKRFTVVLFTLVLLACSPIEQNARNTAAALKGALISAQTKYAESCKTAPQLQSCVVINQAVAGQNALITAIESYCSWDIANPPVDTQARCVPVKTAEAGLKIAISNGNLFIASLKEILK